MVQLAKLVGYCDELLGARGFQDYAPNGLQVEGRAEVTRLVTGVTASAALLEQAIDAGADAVLVHHGFFWKSEPSPVTGLKARRLGMLLRHGVSLVAYHLPLDTHQAFGNNAQLGRRLAVEVDGYAEAGGVPGLLAFGRLSNACSAADLSDRLSCLLGRAPLHVGAGSRIIHKVAWCSGAAQRFLAEAVNLGVDAYVSGEISESTTHEAREYGIHYFAAGHHATERYGVQALGEHLAARLRLDHHFIDDPNPV
ncbi:MAG: Nif3-like dinuclear metal center hexameric protein [Nitrococcus sp.]|nr:Nif3-like dinuclear metal center hexameric protein [Nitrococcus sp.]